MNVFDKNGNALRLLDGTDIVMIDCNIGEKQSLTDERLKDCFLVICNLYTIYDFSIPLLSFDGYSVNKFNNNIELTFESNLGRVTNKNTSGLGKNITKIIGFKRT